MVLCARLPLALEKCILSEAAYLIISRVQFRTQRQAEFRAPVLRPVATRRVFGLFFKLSRRRRSVEPAPLLDSRAIGPPRLDGRTRRRTARRGR